MGDFNPVAFERAAAFILLISIVLAPVWIPIAIPALFLFGIYAIARNLAESKIIVRITPMEFVHLTAATAASALLPWFSGYLTSSLALVAILDMSVNHIQRAVDNLWYVTLMQASLFTSSKVTSTQLGPKKSFFGWSIKLIKLIWWNEKVLYQVEKRFTDLRNIGLIVLLIVSIPMLAVLEVVTILSAIGATALWSALLPISAAILDNGRTIKWAAAVYTSLGIFMYLATIVLVTGFLPHLQGKLIKLCRRRDQADDGNAYNARQNVLLIENNFDTDSVLFMLGFTDDISWSVKDNQKSVITWEVDDDLNCKVRIETARKGGSFVKDVEKNDLSQVAQDLALNQRQLIRYQDMQDIETGGTDSEQDKEEANESGS